MEKNEAKFTKGPWSIWTSHHEIAEKMYAMLSEVGADLEMALNGAFTETLSSIKTWREILYEDVEKIKQLLKEARGEE